MSTATHKDFPLSPRKGENGWCKKVAGKMHSFAGTASDCTSQTCALPVTLLRAPRHQAAAAATQFFASSG